MICTIVKEGEKVIKWDTEGKREIIEGPKAIFNFLGEIEKMRSFSAGPNEFLEVSYKNGKCEHIRGPAVWWLDPVQHEKIQVNPLININANEAVVIYGEANRSIDRRVIKGPALIMLEPNEWLHDFSWHGSQSEDSGRKVPRALQFNKLRVIPDQLYFDVEDVRTTDEALITVQLMVFFELIDIQQMLDKTHDPIADFINALAADIISFASQGDFESFKDRTEKLNAIDAYPQLLNRAKKIGYRINKVVYRGYKANKRLQEMHDQAIEARTALILEGETAEKQQQLEDLKLERQIEREKVANEQEKQRDLHRRELLSLEHETKMKLEREASEQKLELCKAESELRLETLRQENEQKLALWQSMADSGVDLTQVLVAENKNPDRLIKIEGSQAAQFHMHED